MLTRMMARVDQVREEQAVYGYVYGYVYGEDDESRAAACSGRAAESLPLTNTRA